MRRCAIVVLICLVAGLDVQAGKEYPAKPGEQVVANELIVRLRPGPNVAALIAGYLPGAQIQALDRDLHFRISVPGGLPGGVSTRIAADAQVEYVEPNRVRHTMLAAPNDPNYASSWWLQTVQALPAWSLLPGQYLTAATAGAGRVKVAVLDTGADCTHPDFINTGGNSTDSAQGGQLMFSVSHAYVVTITSPSVCTWQDDHGHGTHVSGIVAAATSNAAGVSGLGYPVQVIEYKVLDYTGSGFDTTISQAIRDAADAGAQVVSMSLGGAGYSQTFQDAITYAWQRNTLVIAAAGNSSSSSLFFPAGANHAVGVSATDSGNNLAGFSNFGNSVQLAAPGVGILSTAPTYSTSQGWLNYISLSGTSMATPFVSALAGLLAMTTPNATAQAILQRMEQTASSITAGGGWGQNFGYGIINASTAVAGTLRAAVNGAMAGQIVNASSSPISGAQITVNSQTITTDPTGLYRFATLPAGTYPVTVSATGVPTQSLSVTIAPGADTPFTVAMGVTYGKFTGAVTDQGAGVAGAIVQALSGGLITAAAVADLNGQYTLWVPGGTYDVRASAIGRNTATVSALTVSASGTTSANLILSRLGSIAGSVRDGSLNPVANAQLLVTGGGFSAGATTDLNGNYSLIGVPTGSSYSATASATGFLPSTQSGIAVSADVTTNVSFTVVSSTVAAPTFNPAAGAYGSPQSVSINTTTSGASIRYTTDGSTPTSTTGTLYNSLSPVAVNSSLTLKAIAYKTGMTDSAVASAAYTINSSGPAWYNPSWTNRKAITIDHTKVSGAASLTNFPVLFSVTDANLKSTGNGGNVGKSDGTDIVFTASDAVTKLSHEIERYNPATGELVAWVKVPALSPSADTGLYVYYGNAAAADQQDRVNTWDSNYKIVNHLKDPSGPVLDSTSNANNATPSASGATLVSAGKMGSAYSFDGVNGLLTTPGNPSWNGSVSNYTVQMWVKFNAMPQDYSAVVAAGGWGGPLNIWFYANGYTIFRMDTSGFCQTSASLTFDTTTFHQLALTYNGSQLVPYLDGVAATPYPASCSGTISLGGNSISLGGFSAGKALPSTIDEFRISTATRSPDWILTEYRNQNSSATFYTVGSQETSGAPSQVAAPTFNPPAGAYGSPQSVSISTTTSGASIRYTTDGTTPSETLGTLYNSLSPVAVNSNLTLKAIAYKTGMTDSAVATAAYTIQVAAPTFNPPAGAYGSPQSVSINTTTSGASIRYTTDGSAPSETLGTLYNSLSPVAVNNNLTLKAIAYETGMTDSAVASAAYTIQVAAPTFNPAAGAYGSPQSVSINTTTSGASIRYTTDGSTPTSTTGTLYNSLSPVAVNSSLTLKAIAYKTGMTDSAVASAAYTINSSGPAWYNPSWTNRKAITIDHTKVSGAASLTNFPVLFSVTDANLKSTGNGGNVGKSDGTDIVFTASDAVTKLSHEIERYNPATGELVAWVKVPALSPSADTGLYVYYGNAAAADQQDRVNTWDSNYKIVNHLKDPSGPVLDSTSNANNATPSASGATLVSAGKMGSAYSFDGVNGLLTTPGNPSWNGSVSNYTVQMWVKFNAMPQDYSAVVAAGGWGGPLNIWFYANGYTIFRMDTSGFCQTSASLTFDTTTFHQLALTYNGSQLVPYLDGVAATPYPASCSGTISLGGNSISLGGFSAGKALPSTIDEFRISTATRSPDWILTEYRNQNSSATFYTVGSQETSGAPSQVAAPTFNPPAGAYGSPQSVSISTTTSGASIRYTTDGTTPSETLGTLYNSLSPVAVNSNLTLKAIAYKTGMTDSAVATAAYTIQVAAPTFNPPAGAYGSPQSVSINTTTSGASIRYTTDGSAPSETLGTLYNSLSPVAVNNNLTLKAIAYETGMTDSAVASAAYTIQVAAPTFNPAAGAYGSPQSVSINTTTSGASIRYTTDGSTPTSTTGTLYNSLSPVAVNSSLTLKAIAYKTGMTDSAVASAAYTINSSGPAWYNPSWTNRKAITIDHTKVSGAASLTNFPVLFSVTDANLKSTGNGGNVGKSDGTDIVFTASDAVTKLSHEIERYNPATGELVAWVKVPALSPSADTGLYVYYGNAAAADQQDRVNTWDSNYKIVNHLKDPSGPVLDSTSNANNATPSASGATLVSAGKMGSAYSFDGVNGLLTTPGNPSWNGSVSNYTVQMWVKFNAMPQDYSAVVAAGGWGGPLNIWFYANGYTIFRMDTSGFCQTSASLTFDTTTFHQLALTYNGSQLVPYLDGVAATPYPASCSGTISLGGNSISLGGFSAGKALPSTIDEFRISTATRSPDWILTEYRNQNSSATFYTVGSQETHQP